MTRSTGARPTNRVSKRTRCGQRSTNFANIVSRAASGGQEFSETQNLGLRQYEQAKTPDHVLDHNIQSESHATSIKLGSARIEEQPYGWARYKNVHNGKDEDGRSIFHTPQSTALDPSLVHPTSLIEQQNNMLFAQDVGKLYQLAVKDYGLEIRDDRIRAKDAVIAELQDVLVSTDATLTAQSGQLLRTISLNEDLNHIVGLRNDEIARLTQENFDQAVTIGSLRLDKDEYVEKLRELRIQLGAAQLEVTTLQNRRMIDGIIRWLQRMLPSAIAPSWILRDRSIFPFLKLPGEIRNQIYKHCLVVHHPIDFWPILPTPPQPTIANFPLPILPLPHSHLINLRTDLKRINSSLLRVNKRVHKEATSVLYACNRFRFSDRGGWTILCGFLTHINRNCQFLTSLSVPYPEWCSVKISDPLSRRRLPVDEDAYALQDRREVLKLFGNADLDSPTGPSSSNELSYRQAGLAITKLPNLKRLDFVVPHDVHIYSFGAGLMVDAFTPADRNLMPHYSPSAKIPVASQPERGFVVLRRDVEGGRMKRFVGGQVFGRDVDDDVAMGRARLAEEVCVRGEKSDGSGEEKGKVVVRTARYGEEGEKMSYMCDGDEEVDVEVPEWDEGRECWAKLVWRLLRK